MSFFFPSLCIYFQVNEELHCILTSNTCKQHLQKYSILVISLRAKKSRQQVLNYFRFKATRTLKDRLHHKNYVYNVVWFLVFPL